MSDISRTSVISLLITTEELFTRDHYRSFTGQVTKSEPGEPLDSIERIDSEMAMDTSIPESQIRPIGNVKNIRFPFSEADRETPYSEGKMLSTPEVETPNLPEKELLSLPVEETLNSAKGEMPSSSEVKGIYYPSVRPPPKVKAFRSWRVNEDDPCYKVLPAALRKYNLEGDWLEYGLYIIDGDCERYLNFDEKPFELFKDYERRGKKPMFMLQRHAAPKPSFVPGNVS